MNRGPDKISLEKQPLTMQWNRHIGEISNTFLYFITEESEAYEIVTEMINLRNYV